MKKKISKESYVVLIKRQSRKVSVPKAKIKPSGKVYSRKRKLTIDS